MTIADAAAGAAILLRSDATDSGTEFSVPVGMQGRILTQPIGSARSLYAANERLFYAQSASGTITDATEVVSKSSAEVIR